MKSVSDCLLFSGDYWVINSKLIIFLGQKMLLVALFVAVAAAYPQELTVEYKEPIPILRSAQLSDETGKYSYR